MSVVTQPVVTDIGSEEVKLTRDQVNLLTAFIDNFKTAVAGSADFAAFKVAVAALDTTGLRSIISTRRYASGRRFPSR